MEKVYKLGTKVRVHRLPDDEDRVRVEIPSLRIVDDDLWFAVQARFAGRTKPKVRGRRTRICSRASGGVRSVADRWPSSMGKWATRTSSSTPASTIRSAGIRSVPRSYAVR
jgi:hypothetical protein